MNNLSKIPEEVKLLIVNFLKGEIAGDELTKLHDWTDQSEENKELFNHYKTIWLLGGKSISVTNRESELILERIRKKINQDIPEKKLHQFWTFTRIAASWLIFILIGGVIGCFLMKTHQGAILPEKDVITSVSAPLGSKSIVVLPDSTKIWVNAGSKITYNNSFGIGVREVQLTGEAYFDVKTNKEVPFLVKTSDITVKALGTRFNVKAYPEEKTITTTLEEGKVILTSTKSRKNKVVAELAPNQQVTLIKGNKSVAAKEQADDEWTDKNLKAIEGGNMVKVDSAVRTELITSWKDETWIIQSEPLGLLAPVLERRFNMLIRFDSEEAKQFKFTGKIRKETIEQIMQALELTAPIQYKFESNIIRISINKNLFEPYKQSTLINN